MALAARTHEPGQIAGKHESILDGLAPPAADLHEPPGCRAAASPALRARAEQLLQLLADDPFRQPPPDEALVGDLRGGFSRRLNIQNRLMYQVLIEERVVKVLRLGTHYG